MKTNENEFFYTIFLFVEKREEESKETHIDVAGLILTSLSGTVQASVRRSVKRKKKKVCVIKPFKAVNSCINALSEVYTLLSGKKDYSWDFLRKKFRSFLQVTSCM